LNWKAYTYVRIDSNDYFHITFNENIGTGAFDRKDIHYMYYDGVNWKDKSGNNLSMPLAAGTAGTLVFDTDLSTVHAELRLYDDEPYLYFAEIDESNPNDYVFKFAKYDAGWQVYDVVATTLELPYTKGVLDIIDEDNMVIYQMVADKFEKWISSDGGETWAKDSEIFDDGQFYIDPVLVYNRQSDARIVIQQYGPDYTAASLVMKLYLYGDSGFITSD
jgi:hypothetical protein